jgi:regulator of protease activity HflC (stomatin/prohibitin superfamily)
MLLLRLLSYTVIGFIAACSMVTPTPALPPSPAPTATMDWSLQKEPTLSGTGDYATSPFEAIEAITMNGESVAIDFTLIFYIAKDLIKDVDLNAWDNYLKNEVIPTMRDTIATVIAQYRAEEIYGEKRIEMGELLRSELKISLATYGLIVTDALIRDIQFSPEYTAQIEQEVIATMTAAAQLPTTTPKGNVDPDK